LESNHSVLPEPIATLIREEQQRQENQFVEVADLDAYLAKLRDHAEFLSDAVGDRCRGFVAFYCNDQSAKRAYITLVLVNPQDRGLGIGRTLVAAVLQLARERGFTTCGLEVARASVAAHALYRSLGFKVIETRGDKDLMEISL
jgi:ribosomal protein S18 acetylase RimI-like enzyme